jgi:putative peptide zinc metalloprotease protein
VSQGDEIARLVNHEVELQFVKAKARFESQQQVVETIRRSALSAPEAANQLPGQEALLEDLRVQFETRRVRMDALSIRAPANGKLIAAPHRPRQRESADRLVSWSGYPTDPNNRDCLLEPGQELMSVATDPNWDAELILSQSEVDRVFLGARVKLALESAPETTFHGVVHDISRAEWTPEQNADRRDDPEAARRAGPPATSYIVRVQLEPNDVISMTGATATSRIQAGSISMFHRVSRMLNSLIRFRG